jgi:ferrous iron transport protein B
MRKVGLQGRSFVPLLSSFACAIPGIMSTRTIPTFADRLTTILVAPLMSCSARLPVYSLLIAAFIPSITVAGIFSLQGLVMLGMYSLGIIGAMTVALILKHTLLKGEPAPFIMEMPQFRRPSLIAVLRNVLDRVLLFVKSAGTIILACSVVLWFLASHPLDAPPRESYAGQIGHVLEPVLEPLGLSWEVGVGIVASFAAREVFVSALATVYNLSNEGSEPTSLLNVLRAQHEQGLFSLPSALALLVFYVFACMCMSTLAVCYRETGSWRWTAFMFTYMTTLGYGAAWVTYRIALMLGA